MKPTRNLWRVDGDQLNLDLHLGQTPAWQSNRRFVFIIAGTQSGKTSFGPWWLWREIRTHGAGDYGAITASYDLFKLKMLPELRSIFEHVLAIGRYWSGERVLEIRDPESGQFWAERADDPMWGRIILRSAESAGGLEAATMRAAWLDECGQDAFTLESWEAVQRRLSLSQGRVLGTTTPYNLGWLKTEIYDPWRDGDPDIDVVQFPSYANPAFPHSEYNRMEAKLPAWRFAMFYRGEFVRPAGLIYSVFTDAMLVDPFPIPADWLRCVAIDFGGANVALLWLARSPLDIWYLYHEWLGGGKTTADYVSLAIDGLLGARRAFAVGGSSSEGQQRRDWAAAGLPVREPPVSDIEVGLDRAIGLVQSNRVRVFRTCIGIRDELGGYRRKLDAAGQPTDEIVDKRKYHRLDAFRYAASEIEEPDSGETVLYDDSIRVSIGY